MKKILILLIILLTGCNINNKESIKNNEKNNSNHTIEKQEEKKEDYTDNNPIKLGIYMYYNSYTDRKKITEYSAKWEPNTDICSLEVFYTNEEYIKSEKIKKLWTKYKNEYENIDNYKIGYNITFKTEHDGIINKNILHPNDVWEIFKYIQLYLYDDIHQEDNAWYSHVTEEEYNNNTILTSIKLASGGNVNEIISDIELTIFTYDDDDFDDSKNYRGKSKEKIIIKRT